MGKKCQRRECNYCHGEKVMCRFDAQGTCKEGIRYRFVNKWWERDKQENTTVNRIWNEETRYTRDRKRQFFEEGYRGQKLY